MHLAILLLAPSAGPLPWASSEQFALLAKRDAALADCIRAHEKGDHRAMIDRMELALRIQLEFAGPWHSGTDKIAERLGQHHAAFGDVVRKVELARLVVEARVRLHGEKSWRVTDARLDLAEALARPKRTRAQKDALDRARAMNRQSLAHSQAGRHAEAAKILREVVALREKALGEVHPDHLSALISLALMVEYGGDEKGALLLYERALPLARKAWGERHPRHADVLYYTARSHHRAGDVGAAIPMARLSLSIRRENREWRHKDYSDGLDLLGSLYRDAADHAAAVPLLREGLEATRTAYGARHSNVVTSLANLGHALWRMGDYKAARELMENAVALSREASGSRSEQHAAMLQNLASIHKDTGDTEKALSLARRSEKILKETVGEKHPTYAATLSAIAVIHHEAGDLKAALPLAHRALRIFKDTLGERHPNYANSLNTLALLYTEADDYKGALALHQKALAARKAALGERHPDYAQSLNSLATFQHSIGDFATALVTQEKALAICKAALGERHPRTVRMMLNAATIEQVLDRHAAARRRASLVLALLRESGSTRRVEFVSALNIRALSSKSLGDLDVALASAEEALKAIPPGKPGIFHATLANTLAHLKVRAGLTDDALALSRRSLAITREAFGEGHVHHAMAQANLAAIHLHRGDTKDALAASEQALKTGYARLSGLASVQSERQQLAAALRHRWFLDVRLSLPDAGAYPHVLGWKGAVLLRQRQRRLFAALSDDPGTREAAEELRAITRRLAALSAAPAPDKIRLEDLTRQQERLQATLSKASEGLKSAPPSPDAVADALPDRVALIDYLFFLGLVEVKGGRQWQTRLVAFVSRKGRPVARVDLGSGDVVEKAVTGWRPLLISARPDRAAAERLKSLVWSPLAKHLEGIDTVLVSPDGPLAAVPFAALPGKKAGAYLLEDVALGIVPVPAMLPQRPTEAKGKPSLLCLGDVEYGKGKKWSALPGTAVEAETVQATFASRFKGGTVAALSGRKASREAVREALPKARFAHLATHGYFAPEGLRSALDAAGRAEGVYGAVDAGGSHPLLLSGLVLAGANAEDGVLTALEVSEMDLPNLDLAVLSACETGLGRIAGGEGLLGLQRAFQAAGARTVIASLWSVDDRATQTLMSDFYGHVWDAKKAAGKAEALRRAQLTMLNGKIEGGKVRGVGLKPEAIKEMKAGGRVPPYYWAAWVLSGDWR